MCILAVGGMSRSGREYGERNHTGGEPLTLRAHDDVSHSVD
jgi:hypothetical protein